MFRRTPCVLVVTCVLLAGCSDTATSSSGSGGAAGTSGGSPVAGAAGVTSGGSTGGSGAAQSGSGGGGTSSAGAASGAAGTAGSGGASGGGGGGGGGGASTGPKSSAGCKKAPGMVGERQLAVNARTGLYIVSLPKAYDQTKAYPLGFAFHGRNRNHKDCQNGDCAGFQTVMSEQAVLVYMQSLREPLDSAMGGWESMAEREDNAKFFELVLAQIETDFCVDEKRVFLAGTSSGASFTNLLGCRYGDRLLAVSPVSGGLPESQGCKGAPAADVIHGIDDPHVPFTAGETARDNYLKRAGCTSTTVPLLADMHAEVRKDRDAKPSVEAAKCVAYQGCAAGSPVVWCEHSYGGYDGSTHGWPPVAGQMIWDFVKAL